MTEENDPEEDKSAIENVKETLEEAAEDLKELVHKADKLADNIAPLVEKAAPIVEAAVIGATGGAAAPIIAGAKVAAGVGKAAVKGAVNATSLATGEWVDVLDLDGGWEHVSREVNKDQGAEILTSRSIIEGATSASGVMVRVVVFTRNNAPAISMIYIPFGGGGG